MSLENDHFDRKSLRKILGAAADWKGIAADCVCFANAAGGRLLIGIEDGQQLPPDDQAIDESQLAKLRKRIGELTVNVQIAPHIVTVENGGQFIEVRVARSMGMASTPNGGFYPGSSSSEINRRVAPEIGIRAVRGALERLASRGLIRHEGERRWRRYWLVKTQQV